MKTLRTISISSDTHKKLLALRKRIAVLRKDYQTTLGADNDAAISTAIDWANDHIDAYFGSSVGRPSKTTSKEETKL